MKYFSVCLLVAFAFNTPASAKWPEGAEPFASATLIPKSGSKVKGTVDFAKHGDSLIVRAYAEGLSPEKHGFHIHEKGDCSSPDALSAGGHYNPTGAKHGKATEGMAHIGDFGNLAADAKGSAQAQITVPKPQAAEFKGWDSILGKSIVSHEKADDLKSQPSGNAGARIACGVIQPVGALTRR